jgi:N-acetylmuramoyl-L-alanine amidase
VQINSCPSPNFGLRPDGEIISMIVLHYTGMKTAAAALERLCDPVAEVSAHYFIEEDGRITKLVDEDKRAFHAGISCWRGRAAVNDISIGIELVNPGHEFGYREFPAEQMNALIELAKQIIARNPAITPRNIVGHSDVAPLRKQDPGELFDWRAIAASGIGVWPETQKVVNPENILLKREDRGENVQAMQQMLAGIGYHLRIDGYFGEKTAEIVKAFKRHFAPEQLNESWDMLAQARAVKLLSLPEFRSKI